MTMTQIYELVNETTQQILGESVILQNDLTNVVDVGNAIFDTDRVDHYVRSLISHIGRVVFVDRPYSGSAPSILRDAWEYGAIKQKISAKMPEAEENESWALIDGTSYDPNIFRKPQVESKFFDKRTTFEITQSITQMQVKSAFSNAGQLGSFISMIFNEIDKSSTVKTSSLIMQTINNFTAQTLIVDNPTQNYASNSTVRAVNILKLYNDKFGTSLVPEDILYNPELIRFATMKIATYIDRMREISTLFNIGDYARFTPNDKLHNIMLADFLRASHIYLQSDTYNQERVALPLAETVPFWQGSGTSYSFTDISKIYVNTASGDSVNASGIIGILADKDALGVHNQDKRVTSNWNAKAEFTNYFYKFDCAYYNDFNENFVVFYVA